MRKLLLSYRIRLLFCFLLFGGNLSLLAQCPQVTQATQSFCDSQAPTISSLVFNMNGSATFAWFATSTSSTPLNVNSGLVNGQTYWLSNGDGTCPRQSVTVTVFGAPTGLSFQGVCAESPTDATVSDLIASGNNVQWYLTESGGTPLSPATLLTNNTLYYASQTNPNTGCETSRLQVFVNVHLVPVPTGNPLQVFCNDPSDVPTVGDLQPNGSGYRWYATSSSSVALSASIPLIDGESYYVSTFDPPCESSSRFEVFVDLVTPNDAGEDGGHNVCLNELAPQSPLNLFTQLEGTPDTGGSWTGPFPTSNGDMGSVDLTGMTVEGGPYVFTYTVTSADCPPDSATVTITVLPLPTVNIAADQTICSGDTATVTFTGTPNSSVTYMLNGGANQVILLDGTGVATLTDTYTTTTVIALVNVFTTGSNGCTAPVSGQITITVLPLPDAAIASDQTICFGDSATVTFTGTPGASVIYTVNGGANQTILLDGSGQASITQTYTADTTYTLVSAISGTSPVCPNPLTGSVTISVVPPPVVTIASDVSVCPNGSATVTFTGTPNAIVTYTVNGGTPETIALNASGTATITQNYTVTTVYTLVSVTTVGPASCTAPVSGTVTVTVLPLPTASVAPDQVICPGDSATVIVTGTPGATVTYTINGGAPLTVVLDAAGNASITGTYTVTTTIALVEIVSAGTPSCSQDLSASVVITIEEPATVTIASDQNICINSDASVTFTGTPGATVNYTVNGSPASIVLDASGTAVISGTYTVTTTYELVSVTSPGSPGCTTPVTGEVVISVVPAPLVTIVSDQTICSGQIATVTFTGTPDAIVTYTVNGGPDQTITLNGSGTASITQVYTTTTTYVLVSVSSPGNICTLPVSGTVTITVIPLPTAAIASNQTICENESATITFTGTPGATVNYTMNGSPMSIVLDASGTGTYTQVFTATTVFTLVNATISGCTQNLSASVTITVNQAPLATIASDQTICAGSSATLTISGTPNTTVSYQVAGGPVLSVTLNASGNATLTVGPLDVTTIVNLVDVSNADCTVPLSAQVTITVVPEIFAAISSDQTICPGESATVTFTGTPNAVVSYTLNGAPMTITLDASGNASITNTYTVQTVFTLVSASLSGTPPCTQPLTGSVTISIAVPAVVSIAADMTICPDESATVTFTGTPGATVAYTVNGSPATLTLNASGTAVITGTYSVTTVFELTSVSSPTAPGCTTPVSGQVTITVSPAATVTIATDQTICSGEQATIVLIGTAHAIVTYTVDGGAEQTVTLNAAGLFSITQTYTATTVYSLVSVSNSTGPACPHPVYGTATVTVVPTPTAMMTLSGTGSVCQGQNATITFSGTPGATVNYTLNPGGSFSAVLDASGSAIITPALTENTTITLVSVSSGQLANCIQTIGSSFDITVIPSPNAGTDVPEYLICNNAPAVDLFSLLGSGAVAGGTWSPALASGSGIFNPAVDVSGTYVYAVGGNGNCPADTAFVTVTVVPAVNAGADATITLCSNEGTADLFPLLGGGALTGGTWSPALSSGTSIFDPAVDTAGVYTYTVNGTTPCPQDTAQVTVNVTPGPNAGQDGTLVLCTDSAPQDLFNSLGGTPQAGGTWSPALASGSGVFNPAVDAPGVYTYTFEGTNPCDNDTATVTVTVNPVPEAGDDGTAFFCMNNAPTDLFSYLGGSPQPGGTWIPALTSGTGVFDPATDPAGIYTYTVGGGFCQTDTATVTVTLGTSPVAGADGTLTTCFSNTALDLTSGLDGTQSPGTFDDTDSTGALTGSVFNPSLTGPGTYHFTYTVGGGQLPCEFDTAVVTVVVEATPEAGTAGAPASVCITETSFDLSTLVTDGQTGGAWSYSGGPVTNPITPAAIGAGNHTFMYTVTNSCGTDTVEVVLNINLMPTLDNSNLTIPSPVCAGSAVTVNVTGIPDGSYTVVYDLVGVNLAEDLTADFTVTGGSGSFSIPSASLVNPGVTTIIFQSILNTGSGCSSNLSNVLVSFNVVGLPDITGAVLNVGSVCFGADVQVGISGATGIADGTYTFGFTVPENTPSTGASGPVNIIGGSASFVIPATFFAAAGNFTLVLNSLDNGSGCANNNLGLSANFAILPIPDLTGASLAAADVCFGSDGEVIISDAASLADGTYEIAYQLSGAAVASGVATVAFTAGDGSFAIPASELPATGSITISIQDISVPGSSCPSVPVANLNASFEVSPASTPTLNEGGDAFCGQDNPTIADLSANISGSGTLIWYDAISGGNMVPPGQQLVHGTTYYAALDNGAGCESPVRLAVTADLDHCDELLIPDGFSPNGDGINDEFVILHLPELYPNFKLEIYNRYGNLLYKGDISTPNWNGTANQGGLKLGDGTLPVGVYFYILEFNDGERRAQQGRIYLSR